MDNLQRAILELTAALDETYKIRKTLRAVDMVTMLDDVGRVEHFICSVRSTLTSLQREQATATLAAPVSVAGEYDPS